MYAEHAMRGATACAHDVALFRLCRPLSAAVSVELGPVDVGLLDKLHDRHYDFAPIRLPAATIGWGLIRRDMIDAAHLTESVVDNRPEYAAPAVFLSVDEPYVELEQLFIALAASPAVLVIEASTVDGAIYGLVTRSDLNAREVRRAAYELLVEVEGRLADMIKLDAPDPWQWIEKLAGDDVKARVLGYAELMRRRNMDADPLSQLTLMQLLGLAGKSPWIRERLGVQSRTGLDEQLDGLSDFRNRVMHPVRPLISDPGDLQAFGRLTAALVRIAAREDAGEGE